MNKMQGVRWYKRKRLVCLLIVLCLELLGVLLYACSMSVRASIWLALLSGKSDSATDELAIEKLVAEGQRLVPRLEGQAMRSGDSERKLALLHVIARIGGSESFKALVRMVETEDDGEIRGDALCLLSLSKEHSDTARLSAKALLSDRSVYVRGRAAMILGGIPSAAVTQREIDALSRAFARDRNAVVRANAVGSLAAHREQHGVPVSVFMRALDDTSAIVQLAGAVILSRLGVAKGRTRLLQLTCHRDADIAREAQFAAARSRLLDFRLPAQRPVQGINARDPVIDDGIGESESVQGRSPTSDGGGEGGELEGATPTKE